MLWSATLTQLFAALQSITATTQPVVQRGETHLTALLVTFLLVPPQMARRRSAESTQTPFPPFSVTQTLPTSSSLKALPCVQELQGIARPLPRTDLCARLGLYTSAALFMMAGQRTKPGKCIKMLPSLKVSPDTHLKLCTSFLEKGWLWLF